MSRPVFVELDDVRLAYRRYGEGSRTVVLLHGWPQTGLCWRAVAPSLAEQFTVIVPDLRGYGRSGLALRYDKRAMAEDLHQLTERLGLRPVLVAGHDRGARVAHRWALDRPDDVAALALLDILPTREVLHSFDLATAKTTWHWLFHLQPHLPELLVEGRVEQYLDTFLRGVRSSGAIDDETFDAYVEAFSETARLSASFEDYRAQFDVDLQLDETDFDAGRRITTPLLALWGADGALGDKDVTGVWRRYATGPVAGVALQDCGHYLPEEQPGAVTALLLEFFLAHQTAA